MILLSFEGMIGRKGQGMIGILQASMCFVMCVYRLCTARGACAWVFFDFLGLRGFKVAKACEGSRTLAKACEGL